MPELSLDKQLVQLLGAVSDRISRLHSNDPMRDWFSLELEQFQKSNSVLSSLDDTNARVQALKQLSHLVFQHYIRLHSQNGDKAMGEDEASYLTIEARLPENVLRTARELKFSIEPSLLHDAPSSNSLFDPVSPTAKVVGYLRGLDKTLKVTDQLSMETQGRSLMEELGITDSKTQLAMAVLFQSRYHAINAAMGNSKDLVKQVVEFAAGISPRGYQWSSMSPGTIYIESDLPQLMIHKAKLLRNAILQNKQSRLGVLHCCSANVLDIDSMIQAVEAIDTDHPFTIVTEGLLLYFGYDEMTKFLSNMRRLLAKFAGAVWVTDLVSRDNLRELLSCDPGVAAGVRKVFQLTQRDVIPDNPFESESCVRQHLEKHQLRVDSTVALHDVCDKLGISREVDSARQNQIVGTRKIWRISASDEAKPMD